MENSKFLRLLDISNNYKKLIIGKPRIIRNRMFKTLEHELKINGFNSHSDFLKHKKLYIDKEKESKIKKYLYGIDIEMMDIKTEDPFEKVAIMTSMKNDSILFINSLDYVYVGPECKEVSNVNLDYCRDNNIPVIRGKFPGQSHRLSKNDQLIMIISLNQSPHDNFLIEIINNSLNNLGIDCYMNENSETIRYDKKTIVSSCKPFLLDKMWYIAADIIMDYNYDEGEKSLLGYKDIRKSIKTINSIKKIDTYKLKISLINTFKSFYNSNIINIVDYDYDSITTIKNKIINDPLNYE